MTIQHLILAMFEIMTLYYTNDKVIVRGVTFIVASF